MDRKMEKYDTYLTRIDAELYASYCSKAAVIRLAKRLLEAKHIKAPKGYHIEDIDYAEWDDDLDMYCCESIPCKKIVAEVSSVKDNSDTSDPNNWNWEWVTLCYYVDDSIEW